MDPFDDALKHSRMQDLRNRWKLDKLDKDFAANERRLAAQAAAARLAQKAALLAADKAAEEAAPKAAREARFLELGMKFEAHRNAKETYPPLTAEEFAEAGALLGESGAWNEPDEKGMSWRANAAAHLDILAFTNAIQNSQGTSGTTEAVANPYASIVDAVFEAHGLRMGL